MWRLSVLSRHIVSLTFFGVGQNRQNWKALLAEASYLY